MFRRAEQAPDRQTVQRPRDEDPASRVAARLRRSGDPFLRAIECECRDGVTILSGTVPTLRLRQIARELAAHTPGVYGVVNRLRVATGPTRRQALAKTG